MATQESTGIRTTIMMPKGKNMDSGLMKEAIRVRWDRTVQRYAILPGHGFISEEEKAAWKNLLLEVVGTEKLNVLDVGCGTGVITLLLAEMGHTVTGLDFSEGMLGKAKERAK